MKFKKNKLIVVLGMHRSGTSAITRGLQALGVNLGETLYGAMPGVNEKGFWEDIHVNTLNVEMLGAIESDWAHVSAISENDVKKLHDQGYFLRATELLGKKVNISPIFAFKDPRVAKLMPFWREVFANSQFDVSYVLAIRNPRSVAMSLMKRDGLDAEQSYLLWMSHVLTSLTFSADNNRVLIDYDRLMQSPDHELCRIANGLGLEVNSTELQRYKSEFLEGGLRHTVYNLNDLLLDTACPQIVREIYPALLEVASDRSGFDALKVKVAQWTEEFERLKSPLMLIDKLILHRSLINQKITDHDSQIASLNQAITERDNQIVTLNQAITEHDSQIGNLNQVITNRDSQIVNLHNSILEYRSS
ncbi:MAG: sulfotransferase, partial [Pseudomonadota bacterium]